MTITVCFHILQYAGHHPPNLSWLGKEQVFNGGTSAGQVELLLNPLQNGKHLQSRHC